MDVNIPPDQAGERRRPEILIAEDVTTVRLRLEHAVRAIGFEPLSVSDGRQALTQFAIARPPVVLLDINMPMLDGIEVCRRIRETSEDVRIVIITADARSKVVREAMSAGANDFISKPFTLERLGASLERILSTVSVASKSES
jgi:CheY-like chemotaxis protein